MAAGSREFLIIKTVTNSPPPTAGNSPPRTATVFNVGEVTRLLGVEAYALRLWDDEFPSLRVRHNASGQRIYDQSDLELLTRIRGLLYEERYTIAGARNQLEAEPTPRTSGAPAPGGGDRQLIRAAADRAGGTAIHLDEATAAARRIASTLDRLTDGDRFPGESA